MICDGCKKEDDAGMIMVVLRPFIISDFIEVYEKSGDLEKAREAYKDIVMFLCPKCIRKIKRFIP